MEVYKQHKFKTDTIDPSIFQIEDVASDNACLYRSLANGLNSIIKDIEFKNI